MGEMDLDDMVLSWSVQEITDDDLYRDKVETIPCNFMSLDHYLTSYRLPLIEETRSDLCSCLELIREAPSSKILSMEVAGKSGSYFMDVDFWDNEAGFSTGAYAARNGDIFILSSMKPEAADDLNRHGVTYCFAMVTEVSMDDQYQKGFRVKVAKDIGFEEDLNKLKHAIFLNNITTNMRIWKALTLDTHMNNNFTVIKSLLAPTNLIEDVCGFCIKQDEGCLASFTEQLLSIKLNRSQLDAIESVISAVRCTHVNLIKLIWGPPGTGKTKTVSTLLWVLACLKCRTLTCAPTNVAVVGVCTRFLQNWKDFNEHIDDNGLPPSLGDILLFGSRSNMDITEDLQEVFLDSRVDELVECFSSLSGWKYRIASVVSFFEDCASRYDMHLEDDGKIDLVCFVDFVKKQFDVTAIALKRCIMTLWVHLPGRCFSHDSVINISTLLNMLEKFGALLCDVDLTDEGLKTGLGCLSTENSVCPESSIEKELDGTRSTCLKLLKDLLHSLNLPTGVDKNWVQSYCIRNATLLFCTASSSYRLHHMEIEPLDVLIVDEAAQVRECELVIPLRLHWFKHVILVGDDCQLSAMVKSKVCKEAGFGTSLYGRLVMLKFEKHLLNIQYRMNPCISLFPNAQFYERMILDGPNVQSPSYNKDYTCLPFGSYTFINVTDGREDKEGTGNSRRNMVEVAVVLHLIHSIFKSWKKTGQWLTIGVVSPYNAQVDAIKSRLGKKYDTCDGFHVRVKSIDGFQGEEDDIVILSTVRSNGRGVVGFLADNQRTNVALTRARHCLWIVGNAQTLYKSGTEWTDLVADAERRKCVFSATNDATICKLVLQVKQELDELDDLLNADSAVFSNTKWKVILSDEFRKSFTKLRSPQLRREVLQKLIRLGGGWRTTVQNVDIPGTSHLAKVYKVRDLYLVWSTDMEKTEKRYFQIIRIWDLLSQQNVARTIQRLENLFSMYTDDYLDHCKRVQTQGKLEVPMVWDVEHDIIRYNKDCKVDAQEEHDLVDTSYAMENSKVSESFLLMKFYSLSSGVAKHLLTATDGSEIDIPFELTDEEHMIIQFPLTSFILGRSGTGKTTVLTMKLIQKEQQSLIASQGLNLDGAVLSRAGVNNTMALMNGGESFVKQVFITVSPKLCSAIKNHICKLKSSSSSGYCSSSSSSCPWLLLSLRAVEQQLVSSSPERPAMSAGHSQHSVTSSTRRRQEAELAAAEERERAAAAIAAAAARAPRLAAAELAAARAEVEAAAAADAAREAAAEVEVLRGSANSSVSGDGSADADCDDAAQRAAQWAAEHAQGGAPGGGAHGGGAPGGGAHGGGAPGGGAHGGSAPGGGAHGGGAPGGGAHGGGGWDDHNRGLYGVRTVVRDVGSGVGWPTLTKTNYVEWAAVMRIRLQVRHMWEAIQYDDVDHHEDLRALDALIAAVPPEMQFSLSNKRTAKEAWDAIAAARIGSDRARKSTLQALRKEWENLAFKPDLALVMSLIIMDDLEEFTEIPDNFRDLPHEHYPLTVTYRKFLMMLDGTCRTSFFDAFYGEMKSSIERGHSKSRAVQTFIELKEVTYEKFATFYWPHFNAELTKKFDASTVFTEIISHIKGVYQANRPYSGKLGRQDYVMLSEKRFSSLNSEKRERIYDIYLEYESMKCTSREFDLSDFVNSLHGSLVSEGYNGDMVDFVYIDEVQDLTMTQIALLKYVCRNIKEGFLFAGDTAQTIARGIDFRFEDIRSLFYTAFLAENEVFNQGLKYGKKVHLSDMFQLSQNFRTHCGILRMAQSIMSLLYSFFPSSVDKLNPETGLVYGEAPVLLESDNDENAIMTIFGESKNNHGNLHGFGAEQVILVRDDVTKKQIIDLVGKQALVLTIVECKGLEFQDVLLYNFFGSSPLRNKWRVLYGYMKDKDIIAHSEEISYPGFDRSKHYLLCSELKQLYVAVTRTRQRLWICENTDDYCRPMFDYWKKLCLVEVRLLDSSLIQAMQAGSSSDDWRLRGTKLFNEGQFEMATMCFEKAGDAHREKWARAAGLVATADRVISTNFELGKASLQTASEIYESIGMHEKAAACYIKLRDFKRAGTVYMQKCGTSRLEDAGDCFAMAECWTEAAEVYFEAKSYTKCFSMCSKGKRLFNLGLQFMQQLEEEHSLENSKSLEVSAVRKKYLDNCAQHYFERGDIKHMMPFVKAFSSMDHVRAFLNSRNLIDELLSLEMEVGNFLEAAGIAKHKGDVLLEVDMLEKADLFEDATQLLLLHIIVDSLWSSNGRGWPPRRYPEKEQLLANAKEMAKKVSECFYRFVCLEADALSDVNKSLSNLTCTLLEGRKCANLLVELIASRSILDVHLQSRASGYNLELGPGSEDENSCNDLLACNQISPQTLLYVWNHWKSIIMKVLSHLRHTDGPELNDCAAMYGDFCAKYFGLRKDGDDDRYVVLNMNSSWISNAGRNSLQQDGNRCLLDAPQCHLCAQYFWMNELSSVGLSVLKKLESIVQIPPKPASSYALVRTILIINEIAKFLEEPEFGMPKSSMKLRSFFVLCERRFFELVFLVWKDGTTRSLLHLLDSPAAYGLIADSLGANLRPTNKNLTYGHIGRITMLLLHAARLDSALLSRLLQYLDNNSEWADFFRCLKKFLDNGVDRSSLILNFKVALDFTFNTVKWKDELDYISPICYVGLMECLGFLASSYFLQKDFICCTKSLLVNMLECRTSKVYLDSSLLSDSSADSDLDRLASSSGRFIFQSIMTILVNKQMLQEWVHKTSTSSSSSYKPVLLRLVVILYPLILTFSLGSCYEVTNNLLRSEVFKDLPLEFSQKIVHALQMRSRTPSNFTKVLADALAAIGDHMVVIGSPKGPAICRNLNAYMISKEDLFDVPKVMALLRPEEPGSVKQETPLPEKSDGNKSCNVNSGNISKAVRGNNMESRGQIDISDESTPFWEKFENFQINKQGQKDARIVVQFLRSALPWLEQTGFHAQLLGEVRNVCSEFEERSPRMEKTASLTLQHLYSLWLDGENKLQAIIRFLSSQKPSMKEGDRSNGAAAAVQSHTDGGDRQAECSEDEADTGDAAGAASSASQRAAQKQKGKKKSKKSKGRGRK